MHNSMNSNLQFVFYFYRKSSVKFLCSVEACNNEELAVKHYGARETHWERVLHALKMHEVYRAGDVFSLRYSFW